MKATKEWNNMLRDFTNWSDKYMLDLEGPS